MKFVGERLKRSKIKLVQHPLNRTLWKTEKEMRSIRKITGKSTSMVLDIGAFIGVYSLLFAKRFRSNNIKIYAFEPVPVNYEILVKNIKLNNFEKFIEPFNLGFDSKEGDVIMGIPPGRKREGNNGLYTIKVGKKKLSKEITCKVIRLADFVKTRSITNIDLIKIDVEGREIDILEDSRDVLPYVRYIHFEKNSYFDSSKKIAPFLKKMGFRCVVKTHNINEIWKNKKL